MFSIDSTGRVSSHFTYSNCSKTLNTFLFLFFNEMFVIRAEIHKMVVRIENMEDHDQQSDLGLPCLFRPFWQATSIRNFRKLPYLFLLCTKQISNFFCH